ncbi:DUF3156 family protein [Dactylosporangium maewongense]|uniref:DUF3156 family protein n=2 Tax=Micromonosporaceae TaxID=28056 RepID=A0ABN2B1Q8_9ACTN
MAQPTVSGQDETDAADTLARILAAVAGTTAGKRADPDELLSALSLLHALQQRLARFEPELVAAARRAGVSWQRLAPAMGVTSRQAAERRYLRIATTGTGDGTGGTREDRVRAERDQRAGTRAVTRWANDRTADLRRIAGQVTALTDLPVEAAGDLDDLHAALGAPDAAMLPDRLAAVRQHLTDHHLHLASQIDQVTTATNDVRHATQQQRDQHGGGTQT